MNDEPPRVVDQSPRSYISVYQYNIFVKSNPEIDPMS